jgi:hypothetical protein
VIYLFMDTLRLKLSGKKIAHENNRGRANAEAIA